MNKKLETKIEKLIKNTLYAGPEGTCPKILNLQLDSLNVHCIARVLRQEGVLLCTAGNYSFPTFSVALNALESLNKRRIRRNEQPLGKEILNAWL